MAEQSQPFSPFIDHRKKSLKQLNNETIELLRSSCLLPSVTQCISELVENSLDADCGRVTVIVDLSSIRFSVIDDGRGIDKNSLALIGNRHYTAKYRAPTTMNSSDELFGYRGEALASLACLGHVEIISTPRIICHTSGGGSGDSRYVTSNITYHRQLANSNQISSFPARSSHSGCVVTVTNLFSCLPVRRIQILNRKHREIEKIKIRIEQLALIHPKVAFLLIDGEFGGNGKILIDKPRLPNLIESFNQLYRAGFANNLIQLSNNVVDVTDSENCVMNLFVSCLSPKPPLGDYQILFINRRPVKHGYFIRFIEKIWIRCHRFVHGIPITANEGNFALPNNSRIRPIIILQLNLHPRLYDCLAESDKMKIFFEDEPAIIRDILKVVRVGMLKVYPMLATKAEEIFEGRTEKISSPITEQQKRKFQQQFQFRQYRLDVAEDEDEKFATNYSNRFSSLPLTKSVRSRSVELIDLTVTNPNKKNLNHDARIENTQITKVNQSIAGSDRKRAVPIINQREHRQIIEQNKQNEGNCLDHRSSSQSSRSSTGANLDLPRILTTLTTPIYLSSPSPSPMTISPIPRAPSNISSVSDRDEIECCDLIGEINFSSSESQTTSETTSPLTPASSESSVINVDFLYDADDEEEIAQELNTADIGSHSQIQPCLQTSPNFVHNSRISPNSHSSQIPRSGAKRKHEIDLTNSKDIGDEKSRDDEAECFDSSATDSKRRRVSSARDCSDVEMSESSSQIPLNVRTIFDRWKKSESNDKTFSAMAATMAGEQSTNEAFLFDSNVSLTGVSIDKSQLSRISVIGQCDRKFIIGIVDNLLVAIDQHAADERVRLELLQSNLATTIESQPLIRSLEVFVTWREFSTIRFYQKYFHHWGWKIILGENEINPTTAANIQILAAPRVAPHTLDEEDLREFVGQLIEREPEVSDFAANFIQPRALHRLIVSHSCRHAIMFGEELMRDQMEKLVQNLSHCLLPFQCSHGRPTFAVLAKMIPQSKNRQSNPSPNVKSSASIIRQRLTDEFSSIRLNRVEI